MLPLVRRLASRYANRGEEVEDLVQVGSLGLLKAIDRFDLSRDLRLSTFAVPTVLGEIKRHFRDRVWAMRMPRDLQELNAKLGRATERLTVSLGRSPTIDELAAGTQSTPERVLDALQGAQNFTAVSLDEPLGDGRDAMDTLGSEDDEFETADQRDLVRQGLDGVPQREREILLLRFYDGLTQREIADRVGLSQMHVSRLIRRALEAARDRLDA